MNNQILFAIKSLERRVVDLYQKLKSGGSSQDLQSVLDINPNATIVDDNVVIYADVSFDEERTSTLSISGFQVLVSNRAGNISSEFSINDGLPSILINDSSDETFNTSVLFEVPIAATGLIFPAKEEPGDYTLATLDDVTAVRPYKVYTALLTQTGSTAPVATVLENTLGFDLTTWLYDFVGEYKVYVPELNIPNKVALFIGQTGYNNAVFHIYQQGDSIYINTINNENNNADDLISFPVTIEIRVYN
jgi:hypothetical protein